MVTVETKIDPEDLPTGIIRIFKQKIKIDGHRREVSFFFGDNEKAYNMQAYALFLGLGKTGLHNRITLLGADHENILVHARDMKKVKYRLGSPTKEYLALSDDESEGNKKLEAMTPTKMDNALFPSREVKDKKIGVRKALLMIDGVKKKNKGWNF